MLNEEHRRAQELAAQAAVAMQAGNEPEARGLYSAAARLERRALERLAANAPRTRGILAVSLVALLYKARAYSSAKVAAAAFLTETGMPVSAHRQLRELIEAIEHETACAGAEAVHP